MKTKILVCLAMLLLTACQSPARQVMGSGRQLPIYSVEREDAKLAISFDAAWGTEYTEEILDILDEFNIRTTFFVVKFWVETNPDTARLIVNRGHEIGNHSATHPEMGNLSREQIREEIISTHETILETTGFTPNLFRPPFGHYSSDLLATMEELNYHTIQWDVDSLDWKERGVEDIVLRVTSQAEPGSIILFHNNAKYVTQALPLLLTEFAARGLEIVPVSELIHTGDYYLDHEGRQHKKD